MEKTMPGNPWYEPVTYHWLWILGKLGGRKNDFSLSYVKMIDLIEHRAFNHPYMTTICAENGGWVRYQLLPAYHHGHRINPIYHHSYDRDYNTLVKYPSNFYHCVNCGLIGTWDGWAFTTYNCS